MWKSILISSRTVCSDRCSYLCFTEQSHYGEPPLKFLSDLPYRIVVQCETAMTDLDGTLYAHTREVADKNLCASVVVHHYAAARCARLHDFQAYLHHQPSREISEWVCQAPPAAVSFIQRSIDLGLFSRTSCYAITAHRLASFG